MFLLFTGESCFIFLLKLVCRPNCAFKSNLFKYSTYVFRKFLPTFLSYPILPTLLFEHREQPVYMNLQTTFVEEKVLEIDILTSQLLKIYRMPRLRLYKIIKYVAKLLTSSCKWFSMKSHYILIYWLILLP